MQHVGFIRGRTSTCFLRRTRPSKHLTRFSSSTSTSITSSSIQTSLLSNKIRILTSSGPSSRNGGLNLHALALFVRAGPRFEDDSTEGVSYLVERSINHAISLLPPLGSTPSTPLRTLLLPNLEYQTIHVLHTPDQLASSLQQISSLLQTPLQLSKVVAEAEDQDDPTNLAGEYLMDDLLHAVAYGGKGLGRRSVPTPERVQELSEDEQLVERWKSEWWLSGKAAERMILVGVGGGRLEHEHLATEAEKALGWMGKPVESRVDETRKERNKGLLSRLVASLGLSSSKGEQSYEELASAQTEYVGGKVCLDEGGEADWLEGGTQVVLAFEGLREGDGDVMTLEVIATLLGGRKSYQPGGPGTGMQSRLFLNILSKDSSVLSAKAFNFSYSDSGLFGISLLVAGPPSLLASTFSRVVDQLRLLTLPPPPSQGRRSTREVVAGRRISLEEVERAKNRTLVSWLMERENGVGVGCLDDLAFSRPSPTDIASTIASVTPLDIQRVARRVLQGGKGEPTVVAMGPGAEAGLEDAMGLLERAGLGRKTDDREEGAGR
ncbi:Metalloenzyme, LuxS/M16 peptidase-like protein [Mrakia frigida]|uniref:M16 family metallopeptidase n=1 Tax=Mrakia frigida TaxID=29902 RepID=UPI003FCBF16D